MALYEVTRVDDYPAGALCQGLVIASSAIQARKIMASKGGAVSDYTAVRVQVSGAAKVLSLYWDERCADNE